MTDTTTGRALAVSTEADGYPYLSVPVHQLDRVRRLLDTGGVSYWVDEEALSIDGGPEMIVINIEPGTDPAAVQRILDRAP